MFRELLRAYERLRADGEVGPVAYKQKTVNWIIELGGKQPQVSGPFKRGEVRQVFAPDRYRSGRRSSLHPFLLLETGEVLFAMDRDMQPVHKAYVGLLQEASGRSTDQREKAELETILGFLRKPPPAEAEQIKAKDLVALRVDASVFPFERRGIQRFWAEHLESETCSQHAAVCGICGADGSVIRMFPRPLVLFGQNCQVTSFDDESFRSFGRRQTENSPVCFPCAASVTDVLDYLIREPAHRSVIARRHVRPGGPLDPFRSQLAIYWLSRPVELQEQGAIITEATLKAVLAEEVTFEEGERPQADPRHVENLLKLPWAPKDSSLNLDTESFNLAVLSANKARLVVREWFSLSLAELRERLHRFLDALRLIGFYGDEPRARSIAAIVDALDSHDPNMTRALLRTAYLGHAPPSALLNAAVRRLPVLWLKGRQDRVDQERERVRHIEALTSAIKLALFYGKEHQSMDELNDGRRTAPYLCGKLLAVMERAQQISHWVRSHKKLNATIVDRFYGSASTAPRSVFGNLIRLTTTAHLRDAGEVNVLMEDVMRYLDEAGGFPPTLTTAEQAEFHLGFFHQRAAFRGERRKAGLAPVPEEEIAGGLEETRDAGAKEEN